MKEILIYNGKYYRTLTAHNLTVYDDSYRSSFVYIMSNNKESNVFFASDANDDNLNMLSTLIKLLYDKFLNDSEYVCDSCFIDEETKTIELSDPRRSASSGKYTYNNTKWIRSPLNK